MVRLEEHIRRKPTKRRGRRAHNVATFGSNHHVDHWPQELAQVHLVLLVAPARHLFQLGRAAREVAKHKGARKSGKERREQRVVDWVARVGGNEEGVVELNKRRVGWMKLAPASERCIQWRLSG